VHYFHNLFHPMHLREAVEQNWPEVHSGKGQLVVLNGIWSAVPTFHKRLWELTARCTVLVADAGGIKPSLLKRMARGPIHLITVSRPPENDNGILVSIEAV
jgi:hypothetical protein